MTCSRNSQAFERLVRKLDSESRLIRAWGLTGGVSAQVTAIEVEQPDGQTRKMIVRQHGEADLRQNPQVASDEFRLLHLLHKHPATIDDSLDDTEKRMRGRHRWFVNQAFERGMMSS